MMIGFANVWLNSPWIRLLLTCAFDNCWQGGTKWWYGNDNDGDNDVDYNQDDENDDDDLDDGASWLWIFWNSFKMSEIF